MVGGSCRQLSQDPDGQKVPDGLEAYDGVGVLQHELAHAAGEGLDLGDPDAGRPGAGAVHGLRPPGVLADVVGEVHRAAAAARHGHDRDVAGRQPAEHCEC